MEKGSNYGIRKRLHHGGEKVKLSFILMVTESFPLFAEPEWRIILEDPGVFHRKVIPK